MTIYEFLNRLQKVKKIKANEFMALCPAHGDTDPSLHITVKDGNILVKCQGAGCDADAVTKALGIRLADLFTTAEPQPFKVVAEYDYRDEQGQLLYQVCRLDPKDFRMRHRNGSGEYTWNMKGVRRVLYHLPDVILADTVYVVEGEKDADSLIDCGYIATTSPGGAKGWSPGYADFLRGKKIVLIPHRDSTGQRYSEDIAVSCSSKVRESKCILLEGDTIKDISDWLAAGNDFALLPSMEQPIDKLTSLTFIVKTDKSDATDKSEAKAGSKTDISEVSDLSDKSFLGKLVWRLVDDWLPEHTGEKFDLETVCRQLDIKDRERRHHVVKKLSYEVCQGNLEKSDRLYTYTNKTFTLIDWVHSSPLTTLHLSWPYAIEDGSRFGFDGFVNISPGDIIVVAGVSNMGKTAFCTNFLWNNMDKYPCTLMGNEYGDGSKFKRRTAHMTWANPLHPNGTPKFELIERRERWKDIIRPDNINIIDWITLADNFYQIGTIIDGIQSKLRNGIALISLQKAESKELGLGGGFSEHLASLYLTIDFERLTVKKAKEWYDHNPNNEIFHFSIVNSGSTFHNIFKIKKCPKCGGFGKFRLIPCTLCNAAGFVPSTGTLPPRYADDPSYDRND